MPAVWLPKIAILCKQKTETVGIYQIRMNDVIIK